MMIPRALFLGLVTCASLSAQAPAPPASSPAEKPVATEPQPAATETPPPAQAKRPRAISSDLANQLAVSMPKYNPPQPKKAQPETEEADSPVAADQPKNKIIRLPKVIVEGQRPPVFTEREVNTQKGLADIAVKRYFNETGLALNRFRLPLIGMTKEQYAMMLYEEDERLRRLGEAQDNVSILRQTDPAAADELQDDVNSTFIRRSDFTPVSGNR